MFPYGIIERHGGNIEAVSAVDKGTTFKIELPVIETAHKSTDEIAKSDYPPSHSLNVLVVDDEECVRSTLADMIELCGHRSTQVAGGKQALEVLENEIFDFVFTDLSMPEIDGNELAREIRRRPPETRIILLTDYGANLSESPAAPTDVIDELIAKPFDYQRIADLLSQADLLS